MNNNQNIKKTHGGKRSGAGRKAGSYEKMRAGKLLHAIHKTSGKPLEYLIAEHYQDCINRGDYQAVREYEKTFLSKFVADKVDVDHTTLGQPIMANFRFPSQELPDWTNVSKTIKLEE